MWKPSSPAHSSSPPLAVRSTIDREVAAAIQSAMGDKVREAYVRARVDSLAEAALVPVRAHVMDLRGEVTTHVAAINARLQALRELLLAQLRALSG